jgi:hypothetical protein
MRFPAVTLCLVLATSFGCSSVLAMEPGTMHDLELLPACKNKIAVLEYENPLGAPWGLKLSQILTQEIIGSIRGVPSVGVLDLRQDEPHVELTLSNVTAIARRQNAQVVVWGEFYEGGNKTYFHSHLQIVPLDKFGKPSLSLSVQTRKGAVTATPPSLVVNFAPVEFTTSSLRALRDSHQQTTAVRSDPQESARRVATLGTRDGFGVEAVTGPWMKIRTKENVAGWVHYATLENRKELSGLESVVRFAQGALQYLVGNYETAEATMSAYLDGCGKQDEANLALAHILLGNARFRGREGPSDVRVAQEYLKAAELLPNEAAPVNYLAIVRLLKYGDEREYVPEMRDLETRLIRGVQQNNPEALGNLRVFYELAADNGFAKPKELSAAVYSNAIGKQLTLVDEIAKKLDR